MICPYCKNDAEWVDNKELYHKNYNKSSKAYLCRKCDAYICCIKNTKIPFGTMADLDTRKFRKVLFGEISRISKSMSISKKEVYKIISRKVSFRFYIPKLNLQQCEKVYNECLKL